MKRLYAVLVLCVVLFWVAPAFGGQETVLPSLVKGVVRNMDFFTRPCVLWGYEDCFLYDVNRMNRERIGVRLISPTGFEFNLVYDVDTLDVIYRDMFIPEKAKREVLRRESISVADAIKLAESVVEY